MIHGVDGVQVKARGNHGDAQNGQQPGGEALEDPPQDHAGAKAMEHAEINDDALAEAVPVHAVGDRGDHQATSEDHQTPADGVAAQGGANAAEYHEQNAAPIFNKGEPGGVLPIDDLIERGQVVHHMDENHADDADAAENVQFPNAVFHGYTSLAASSSSTR